LPAPVVSRSAMFRFPDTVQAFSLSAARESLPWNRYDASAPLLARAAPTGRAGQRIHLSGEIHNRL